jgi:hypothetical protein
VADDALAEKDRSSTARPTQHDIGVYGAEDFSMLPQMLSTNLRRQFDEERPRPST